MNKPYDPRKEAWKELWEGIFKPMLIGVSMGIFLIVIAEMATDDTTDPAEATKVEPVDTNVTQPAPVGSGATGVWWQ